MQTVSMGQMAGTMNQRSTPIEQIINRIERGEMELADIFDQFAIAVEHLHQCESFLTYHRQQVDLLIETLSDDPGGY